MSKVLSIIVPTYNMSAILNDNLSSLVTKNRSLLDVVIVNDGSTDDSSIIAHGFAEKYPDVFVVIDKPNGNYGSCINEAIPRLRGKYVKIMDADDKVFTDAFCHFVEELSTVDADLIITNYVKEYSSGKVIKYDYNLPEREYVHFRNLCCSRAIYDVLLPAITYRTSILRSISYHQIEGISYSDMEWCFLPMTQVERVYFIPRCLYRYQMGREGQTMSQEIYAKSIQPRMKCIYDIVINLENLKMSAVARSFAKDQLVKHMTEVYKHFLIYNPDLDRSELENLDNVLKTKFLDAYKACGEIPYRLHIPYHFIKDWRESRWQRVPIFVRFYAKCLDILGGIRVKLMKTNPNEER